jgi:hypothetical protein
MKRKYADFIVRSTKLRPTDIFTEHVRTSPVFDRSVVVQNVAPTEILYKGRWVPAYYVVGIDQATQKTVRTFASTRKLWTVTREITG